MTLNQLVAIFQIIQSGLGIVTGVFTIKDILLQNGFKKYDEFSPADKRQITMYANKQFEEHEKELNVHRCSTKKNGLVAFKKGK